MSSNEFISESDDDNEYFEQYLVASEEDQTILKMVNELKELSTKTQKMLFSFQKQILQCRQFSIQEDLNIIIDLIREYIFKIDQGITAIERIWGLEDAIKYSNVIKNDINEIKEKLILWLQGEQKRCNLDHLLQLINNENTESNQDDQLKYKVWKSKQLVISTFKIYSYSIFIHKKNTLLFSSNYNQIRIYGFKSSRKLIKKLIFKLGYIKNLLITNKSEFLLSIGINSVITIWNQNWQPCQMLNDSDSKEIQCIITNDSGDFITGGDKYINFWQKKNSFWSCSQSIDISVTVTNFSLNLQQTKLISSGFYNEKDHKLYHVYLFELINEKWVKIQIFNTNQPYYDNVFFKENNSFVFISRCFGTVETFKYEQKTEQIIRTQLFQFQSRDKWNYNLCHYIRQTHTLIANINCLYENHFIYFLNLDQNEIQQRIDFQTSDNRVTVSKKGNYLIQQGPFSDCAQVLRLKNID